MPDDPRPLPGRKADEGPVGESRPRSPARFAVEALTIVFSILVALGIDTAADVWSELARREGTSGLAEKASRPAVPPRGERG